MHMLTQYAFAYCYIIALSCANVLISSRVSMLKLIDML